MSQLADWFAPALLRASLSLTLAALLVATCVKWLKLRSHAGEQWAWLLVLVQGVMFVWVTVPVSADWLPDVMQSQTPVNVSAPAIVPAAPKIPEPMPARLEPPPFEPQQPQFQDDRQFAVEPPTAIASTPASELQTTVPDRHLTWQFAVCAIWLAGLAFVLVIAAFRYVRFVSRMRRAAPAPVEWSAEWQQLCREQGVSAAIPLVVGGDIGPALCRLPSGHRLVVSESAWAALSVAERSAILRHELEHFRRGDLSRLLVVRLLASIHWFNPLAWLAARHYEAQSEYACDAAAAGDDPATFSELLLQLAARPSRRIAAVQAAAAGGVYERVQRLLTDREPACGWRSAVPVLLATLAIAVATVRVEAVAPVSDPQPEAPTAVGLSEPSAAAIPAQELALAAADAAGLPSLDELRQALAAHEQAYMPYHITSMQTFVINEGLTDQERSQYPWADGRKHQRLWENAQLKAGTWMRRETMLVDDVAQQRGDTFVEDLREIQVSYLPGSEPRVYLPNPKRPVAAYGWSQPLLGLFPLFEGGEPMPLSEALEREDVNTTIEADGDNVKLTVGIGYESGTRRLILWLSRAHAWHPVRFQRYVNFKEERLLSDWQALRLEQPDGQWRIVEGSIQWFDFASKAPEPKPTYSVKFETQSAEYGEDVSPDLFKFEMPANAEVHDPTATEEEPSELTRDFPVTVIDIHGQPVLGATVTSRTRGLKALGRDLMDAVTDEDGIATVRIPDGDFGIRVHKEGSRETSWIIGRDMTEKKAVLAPITTGSTVDEQGVALANAIVSTNPLVYFRSDGLLSDPRNNIGNLRRAAVTDEAGSFKLTSELTLRRTSDSVLFNAVNAELDRMAFVHVPAARLGEPLQLTLQPVCAIEGSCVLEGQKEPLEVRLSIEDTEGRPLADVTTSTSVVEQGLRVAYRFRLPPGEYRLQSSRYRQHSAISIPIKVSAGERELRLEQKLIPPSGVQALIGKPAPELAGTWRSDEGITLANLRGNVVVLDFWGYWCGPCLAGMPYLMDMADEFKDRPVKWLAIHDPHDLTREQLEQRLADISKEHWKGRPLTFPVLIDAPSGDDERSGVTGQRYDIREWPTLILIDRNGNVAGAATHGDLREKINALLPPGEQVPATDARPAVREDKVKSTVEIPRITTEISRQTPNLQTAEEADVVQILAGGRTELTPDNLADVRLLSTMNRYAYRFTWSPDGHQLVCINWEAPVQFRDANSLALLPGVHTGSRTIHFAFGPTASLFAYSENDGSQVVHLVDQETGQSRALATAYRQPAFDFSPDGSLIVTGGYGTTAHVWTVEDGKLLYTLDMGPKEGGLTPVFSPDGSIIAVGNRNSTTRLFNSKTGELRTELRDRESTQGLAFRPQGDQLAIAYVNGRIATWSVETGKLLAEKKTGAHESYNVVWSPSGQMLASAGLYGDITFWSPSDLKLLHKLTAPEWVIDISFSPDGTRLFTSGGGRPPNSEREVCVWGLPDQPN